MENRHGQEVYSIAALTLLLKKDHRSGETRQLRALVSLKEDLSPFPAPTLEESQPAVCNSSFRGNPFLWPLWALHSSGHMDDFKNDTNKSFFLKKVTCV